MTSPATVIESMGLPADAPVVMVFASPFRQFYRDGTTPARIPGLHQLDSLAWTRYLSSVYRDCAKTHANPDPSLRSGQAPTATPYTTGPVIGHSSLRVYSAKFVKERFQYNVLP